MSINEGGYANDSDDTGGETYRGVARKKNPDWQGWEVVDKYKGIPDFPENMEGSQSLDLLVARFYEERYWAPVWGEAMPHQGIADELFDTAVNMGVRMAVRFLQMSLNIWNNNQKLWPNIIEDGQMGKTTLEAVYAYLEKRVHARYLLLSMNCEQMVHYHRIAAKNEKQEKFMLGWASRVHIQKEHRVIK